MERVRDPSNKQRSAMGSENVGELTLAKASNDRLETQTLMFNYLFRPVGCMSVKCAIELGIPEAMNRHGRPITIPELLSALSIPATKASQLRRLMRMVTHAGFFARADGDDDAYSLTALSRHLLGDEENYSSLFLVVLHPIHQKPLQFMSSWFKDETGEYTASTMAHQCDYWELFDRNPEYGGLFSEGLATDSRLFMNVLLKDYVHVFQGLTSLVDVGGGNGSTAKAIAEAVPSLKCSVLELAHVVKAALASQEKGPVEFIVGDMFQSIPPANAILIKLALHNWGDEECVKVLRKCKEAIPSREEGGKVIIIDIVVGGGKCHKLMEEAQLYLDMWMMVQMAGVEREEEEWKKIFVEAGFPDYKITPVLGLRSLIELYP